MANLVDFITKNTVFAAIFMMLVFVISMVLIFVRKDNTRSRIYMKKNIMTGNEMEFFGRLKRALPDLYVFPQVSMGAIMQPAVSERNPNHNRIRWTFSQKIVDYVVCDKTMNIVTLIELDDRTHSKERDRRRDAMTADAGYRVLRFDSIRKPSVEEIRKMVHEIIEIMNDS